LILEVAALNSTVWSLEALVEDLTVIGLPAPLVTTASPLALKVIVVAAAISVPSGRVRVESVPPEGPI
jgi:hypothetical protein